MASKNGNCTFGPSHGHANHVTTTPTARPGPNGSSRASGGPLTGVPWGAGTAGAPPPRRSASSTFSTSAANDPTNSESTATCQPRNAPAIINRSASPRPSASRPKPVSNSHLVARTTSDPTSAPTTAFNRPSFQLPGGAKSNVGPHTGHSCTPVGTFPMTSSRIHGMPGGIAPAAAAGCGHGHGISAPPITPTARAV